MDHYVVKKVSGMFRLIDFDIKSDKSTVEGEHDFEECYSFLVMLFSLSLLKINDY